MTDAPIIAAKSPAKVTLEAGKTYVWCRCGRSKDQPFCDGSHRGTGITPLEFIAEKDGAAMLCRCKASADAPFCDGSHARLKARASGDPVPGAGSGGEGAAAEEDEGAAADEGAAEDEGAARPDGDAPRAEATAEEPTVAAIHALARDGLSRTGPQGEIAAMGVPRARLPDWNGIQILPAQLARAPLAEDAPVATEVVIGPRAARPLTLDLPLFVTDMSFGALSPEAKIALARGAEMAGTGIASGEGGMLPEEKAESTRYLYELAPGRFGWDEAIVEQVQALHFKAGQAAKTGVGGHLPAAKVTEAIARVRGLEPGQAARSPARFADLTRPEDFRRLADRLRERSGGIPIGFKLAASHVEADIDFALAAGADYLILDGRGGGTGAAPTILRDHIAVPTIPALARARAHLDARAGREVTLVVTGGLRMPADFVKALALGADAVALGNAAIQAVGCVAARICNTNACPAGIATQDAALRRRLDPQAGAERLARFLGASRDLMCLLARACGHGRLADFSARDLTSCDRDLAALAGIAHAGVAAARSGG